MIRWLGDSRFRTSIIAFFGGAIFVGSVSSTGIVQDFVFSLFYYGWQRLLPLAQVWGARPQAAEHASNAASVALITGLSTAFVSLVGTLSTIVFAWRADRRAEREGAMKLIQMQQQIRELENRLSESGQGRSSATV